MSAIKEWLSPLPDRSLPALKIREELLKILQEVRGISVCLLFINCLMCFILLQPLYFTMYLYVFSAITCQKKGFIQYVF